MRFPWIYEGVPSSLDQRLAEFKHRLSLLPEAREPPATTLQILGRHQLEQDWQRILFYFLSPDETHGLDHALLEHLLTALSKRDEFQLAFSRFDLESIRVETEVVTSNGGRTDAVIWSPDNWFICWELKIVASEGTDQTKHYVDAEAFGSIDLTKAEIPADNHHYIYLTSRDAAPPKADEFFKISWEWIAEELQTFLADSQGSYPARTTAQIEEFIGTIQSELTMTDYKENREEKSKLYLEYYDEIETAREAFDNRWAAFASNWATDLVHRMEIAEPVEIPTLSDENVAIELDGASGTKERWIFGQGSPDWAGIFREGWWRHKDDLTNTYAKSEDRSDVRIAFFHRLQPNRDRVIRDNILELQLWHGVGNGDQFMNRFKDILVDKVAENAEKIPPSVTVTGKRGNVITATYDIPVAEYDDIFVAYTEALHDAFLDLVVDNDTVIPIITETYEESLDVFDNSDTES